MLVLSGIINLKTRIKLYEYVNYDLTKTYDSIYTNINNADSILNEIINTKGITLDNLERITYINSVLSIEIDKVLREKYGIYYGNTANLPRLVTEDVDRVYNTIMKYILKSEKEVYSLKESDLSELNTVLEVYKDLKGIIESGENDNFENRLDEIYSIQFFNYY